jgi:hypothetical protein
MASTLAVGVLLLAGCASPPPEPAAGTAIAANRIYFYPSAGQDRAQQERDRYECFLAAARQARFDPSAPRLAPAYRYTIAAAPGPIAGAAVADDTEPGDGPALRLDQRAADYRRLVRRCLVRRGYAVR